MPTLILSPRYTPDSTALWRSALALGWKTERLNSYHLPDWLQVDDVVIYGEGLFVSVVAERLGIALIEPSLNWLTHLPVNYLHRNVSFVSLGEVRQFKKPAFIKPADGKLFQAKVYDSFEQLPDKDSQPDDTLVLVSDIVEWDIEFRCFIKDNELMTLSPYVRNGELVENAEGEWIASNDEWSHAKSFCEDVLNDSKVKCPPAFVLDIGKVKGQSWEIVEANPAWASGIYGCDPTQVLLTIQRSCIPNHLMSPDDAQWVIERLE